MKKISLVGIVCFLLSLLTVFNVSAKVLFEGDLSSSDGWKFSTNAISASASYNASTHTTVKFSRNNGMNVDGNFYAHRYLPQTYTAGVLEVEFKMKRNSDDVNKYASITFQNNAYATLSAVYVNKSGSVNINHQSGDSASNVNGVTIMKLLRREINGWHDYIVRIDLDNRKAQVSVDGEVFEDLPLYLNSVVDAFKLVINNAMVKDLKISHYYEVDIEKDGFFTRNIYDSGEVVIKSAADLPSGASLAVAVYKGNKLIAVDKQASKTIAINVAGGDKIKAFLCSGDNFIPLAKEAAIAKPISSISQNGKELLHDYESDNSDSGYDFSAITNTELLDEEDVVVYERETPDGTKHVRRDAYEVNTGAQGTWYSAGTHEEKKQNLLDLAYASAVKYPDGHVTNENPIYYFLTGDIAKAESLIAQNLANGHQYPFTDLTPYYMYFKYGNSLSSQAKANLKQIIKREFERPEGTGFLWNSGELQRLGMNHNQTYDGLLRGFFYAYAFMDDATEGENAQDVFERCNDILDKIVASTAAFGSSIEEYNSQNYAAVVWSYVIALSDLLPEGSEQKAKVDLILNRMDAEIAVLYHPETVTTIAPHARSGFNLVSGITIKQNFPMMLYGLSTRDGYWQNSDGSTYTFFYSQLAATNHRLNEYTESIAYDKEYPKNINMTYKRIATKNAYLVDAGDQFMETLNGQSPRIKHANTVGYMTESYSMGSAPETPWYIPGLRGQETTFLARWTRDDTVDSLSDIPALFSYYRYNIGKETGAGPSFTPVEQGLSATVQHENKAIIYSYPGKVTDQKLAANLGVSDYASGLNFYNMGTSIYVTNPEDTKIYADGQMIAGEDIISTNGNKELRAKLDKLPYTANNPNGNIYLEDKSIYAAIIPLNASKVQIRDLTSDIENNSNGDCTTQANSVYSINLLNNSVEEPVETPESLQFRENFDDWTTVTADSIVADEWTSVENAGSLSVVAGGTENALGVRYNGALTKTFEEAYDGTFTVNYNVTLDPYTSRQGVERTVPAVLTMKVTLKDGTTSDFNLYTAILDTENIVFTKAESSLFVNALDMRNAIVSGLNKVEVKFDVDAQTFFININGNEFSKAVDADKSPVTGLAGITLKSIYSNSNDGLIFKNKGTEEAPTWGTDYAYSFAQFDDVDVQQEVVTDTVTPSGVNFTEAQRHALRNGYIFEIAEKSEYASIDDFIDHIEQARYTTSESNNIWTTEYTSGDDTIKLCFDTQNLYVTESYANGVAQKHAFVDCLQYKIFGKHMYAKTASDGYYYWNTTDFYKQNPTLFKSDNLIQSQAREITIGDCTLTNTNEAMVYIIYSPNTKTYVVGDLTAGNNSYTLTTPYGTVKIDNLDLGYVEFDGETKQVSLNTATGSTATAVVQ